MTTLPTEQQEQLRDALRAHRDAHDRLLASGLTTEQQRLLNKMRAAVLPLWSRRWMTERVATGSDDALDPTGGDGNNDDEHDHERSHDPH